MQQDTRPMLSVRDVAVRLKVSEWTVREWLRLGRLRGIRPGGTKAGWRISEAELSRFIAQAAPSQKAG